MTVGSIRALAPLLGVSHTHLFRQLKRGKFSAEPGGGYDPDKVKAALQRNHDLEQPSQAGSTRKETTEADPAYAEYNRARAIREKFRAKNEEMDLRQRMGELLDRATVDAVWSEVAGNVRNQLLLLPDRLAPRAAAITDVIECRFLIDREVRQALAELSERMPDIV